MAGSEAFKQFKETLGMAEQLLAIDKNIYHNPPRINEQKAVKGLRGGAVVLMVGAFENFLREAFEEHLADLNKHPKSTFDKLPDDLRINNMFFTLDRAMKGPPFQKAPAKIDRLSEIEKACKLLISEFVFPEVFSNTGSNPNSKTVTSMFNNIGLPNIFIVIRTGFDNKWHKQEAQAFLASKLDDIIQRRHQVAHTATVLNISRSDLNEYVKFLKVLAELLDSELKKYINTVRKIHS